MQIVNYKVLNNKKINTKIVSLADIHYYEKKDLKRLNKVLDQVKIINPDYIVLPGDFIDKAEIKEEKLFIDYLNKLASITKVIIGVGNHDITSRNERQYKVNTELFDKIKKINNLIFLDDDIYEENNIRFIGITLPHRYYKELNEEGTYLVEYLNEHHKAYDSDKYNLLICHSPIITLKYYDKINLFKTIDLSLFGHMHGGLMPKCIRFLTSDRGLISPRFKIFPKYAFGYVKDKKAIISSGVTKLSHTNKFRKLNFLYGSEITVINIKTSD